METMNPSTGGGSPGESDEQIVWETVQLGRISVDKEWFESLEHRHAARLRRLASRWVGDAVADGVTAEVLIGAWRSRASFDPDRGNEWLWLAGLARNVVSRRRRQYAVRLRSESEWNADSEARNPGRADIEDRIDLATAIAYLPDKHQLIILLHIFEGLFFADIASALDISVHAAEVRYYRAVEALRRLMSK